MGLSQTVTCPDHNIRWNLTPVRQFIRCSGHHLRDDGTVSLCSEQRPVWKDHLWEAAMLVDVHFNDCIFRRLLYTRSD